MAQIPLTERKEDTSRKVTKLELAKKMDAMWERDNELVSGIFRYLEHPNGTLNFRYKKYARDEYKHYELKDGERYQLPRMVVRHLNNDVYYKEYKHLGGDSGRFGTRAAMNSGSSANNGEIKISENMHSIEKVPRCEFRSLEFMDDDLSLMPSNRITMPYYSAIQDPVYIPANRDILSITNANPASVVTTFDGTNPGDHGYHSGLIARMVIPPQYGMEQMNQLVGEIIVTSPSSFVISIDSSAFDPFVNPTEGVGQPLFTPPQVVPIGENDYTLSSSFVNQLTPQF